MWGGDGCETVIWLEEVGVVDVRLWRLPGGVGVEVTWHDEVAR